MGRIWVDLCIAPGSGTQYGALSDAGAESGHPGWVIDWLGQVLSTTVCSLQKQHWKDDESGVVEWAPRSFVMEIGERCEVKRAWREHPARSGKLPMMGGALSSSGL